jgi:NTP pyrophosphatase (non-canonical NTP hydrolase)
MKYEELEEKIINWAKDRQIIPNATPSMQLFKFFSEAGELADGHAKCKIDDIIDAVGDVMVCLINYCELRGIKITDCMESAYNEIKDRKGTLTPEGIFIKE